MRTPSLPLLSVAACAAPVLAQQPAFTTPGMAQTPMMTRPAAAPEGQATGTSSGQSDRFDSVFNPAFSFIVDAVADSLHTDGDAVQDGVKLEMRVLEIGAQAWVDPDAWAYFIGATDGDTLAVEEAAVHYKGLGGNTTIRAGRFFIDFGKQMQTHVHELRTLERPLVLRTYLGEEVKGDGLEYDGWTGVGDATAVRWSIGAFASLIPESELEDGVPVVSVADRKDAGDLNFTARLTAFTDVGTNGLFQAGVSGRFIPDATAELNGSETTGLESSVYGLDVTYGWTSDDAQRTFTTGGEFLLDTGDTVALIDDAGTPDPTDDTLTGFDTRSQAGWYAFVDWAWNQKHSVGVQYSTVELGPDTDAAELEVYYTRLFSEFHRIRLVASSYDTDVDEGDALRFAIQYTVTVGAHGHGLNW
ncbi:MAG: hypothetical protein NTY35_08540 [Planctomycetota bacterium]|nr:hypothetical protein [Planctomycetota bacterium]